MKSSKQYTVNMPQMAINALSESWLFKELGDAHWDLLCRSLEIKSFDLKNDTDDRLYATFVRIMIRCSGNLRSFRENDALTMEAELRRFGNNMYFSEMQFASPEGHGIEAQLMTAFSIRNESDNTKLAKSEPNKPNRLVEPLPRLPEFGNQYRLMKKSLLPVLVSGGNEFSIADEGEPIFETEYVLNPFYDLNGVNLLYFAAYPIINDVCEARFFNEKNPGENWEQHHFTAFKDVLYYGNCNFDDRIVYRLLASEEIGPGRVKLSSTLSRKSDGAVIARVFVVKSRGV